MVWSFAGAGAPGGAGSTGEMLELTLIDLQKQIDELRALLGLVNEANAQLQSQQATLSADIASLKSKSHTHGASSSPIS